MKVHIYPGPEDINPDVREGVRSFLLKSFKLEAATWPGYYCTIFIDGHPVKVSGGSYYQIYNREVFVTHDASRPIEYWVPGVLLAIAIFFRLENEDSIKQAALDLLARVLANAVRPFQTLLVENFNGSHLTEMAINPETKEMVAKNPPLEEGGPARWAYAGGEEITLDPKWFAFQVPVERA